MLWARDDRRAAPARWLRRRALAARAPLGDGAARVPRRSRWCCRRSGRAFARRGVSRRPRARGAALAPGGDPAGRGRRRRRALDDPQRGRARPLRADLDRRRPGALRRHLPALRRRPGKGRRRGGRPPPGAVRPGATRSACGWSRSSPGWPPHRYPELETDQALSRMGREQLWDDITEEPLEYAGFVADQGRADLVARPARGDARAGLGGAALGAGRLRPARPRPARLAPALGGAGDRRRSSSRSPRSAPCWSPRRGGCW